ncbi:hypothetical protein XA68_10549 [Ophiocordyceps unilateralis]|uniref:Uncharacterized protein n=1 Tax=Ophiocordyceps unilateralis TaxID=268505 RepID=A0A2A9PH10_OPHUN|nr:hypothetical protein XA68_10549 [Ophiocordyceps unilateralis]
MLDLGHIAIRQTSVGIHGIAGSGVGWDDIRTAKRRPVYLVVAVQFVIQPTDCPGHPCLERPQFVTINSSRVSASCHANRVVST